MENLTGKTVILGITGGIAAYKMANVASALHKAGAKVHVIMTENAAKFITPLTFETLTGSKCMIDTFDRDFQFDVRHISVAKEADVILIAPATANVIAKMAHGIADDMLTTVVLAAKCKKLVSPSMNTAMLENPVTQDNIALLRNYGFTIIDSASGYLACGDTGSGKLPEPEVLCRWIEREIAYPDRPLQGKKVVVTAGPTQEALDPVRYLTNHSTGKMGYAIARDAMLRGAEVTLVSGPVSLEPVPFVKVRRVTSAADMFAAIREELPGIADGVRQVVLGQRRLRKRRVDQIIRGRVHALQKDLRLKLVVRPQVTDPGVDQLQPVHVLLKLRVFIVPEDQLAHIPDELRVQFVGDLFEVEFGHVAPLMIISSPISRGSFRPGPFGLFRS